MNSFVGQVCNSIVKNHGYDNLSDVCIVIPSQRIGLHLKKYFSEMTDRSFWLPEILTINDFVNSLHEKQVVDELEVDFYLYQSYLKVFKKPESFDHFLNWSGQIIRDFNEIDKYLIEPDNLFKNLQELKELEAWNVETSKLSQTQKDFLVFWENLGQLYKQFHSDLLDEGFTTSANVYRNIAENKLQYLSSLKNTKIYFVGFNALSKSEKEIMKFITDAKVGEVIWDADEYYFKDKDQEAGLFLRNNKEWSKIQAHKNIQSSLDKKEVKIYPALSNLDQVTIASSILGDTIDFNTRKSALIFGDEKLLKPMLNSIPVNIDTMNVAMGYPIESSGAFALLNQLFGVIKRSSQYKSKTSIYFKDFNLIFGNDLISLVLKANTVDLGDLVKKIVKENYTYISCELLNQYLGPLSKYFGFLFYDPKCNTLDLLVKIYNLLGLIRLELLEGNKDAIEIESIFQLMQKVEKVINVQNKFGFVEDAQSLQLLIRSLFVGSKVSFYGEPLSGLQVLGLLETRGLDFENVILMSCNEDVIPAASVDNSFVPYDLRRFLGLPLKEEKEAIFAYYFYRLLQRSKNIHLIYNNGAPDGMKTNEVSRYILQIIKELSDHVKITVQDRSINNAIASNQFDSMQGLSELQRVKERVVEYFRSGLSASAINKFRECPRDFYFQYILRLSEDEEVEENIESSTFGTIVHKVLELLYWDKKLISKEDVNGMKESFEVFLDQVFLEYFPSGNYKSGKNLLQYDVAKTSIKKFLDIEEKYIEENGVIQIIGLELQKSRTLSVNLGDKEVKVTVKGNIDRVDQVGGKVRIIDYKTGKVDTLSMKGGVQKANDKTIQLLTYLYLMNLEENQSLEVGMISMVELNDGFKILKNSNNEPVNLYSTQMDKDFEEYLEFLLRDIYHSSFNHSDNAKYCRLCF